MSEVPGPGVKAVFAVWRDDGQDVEELTRSLLEEAPERLVAAGVTRVEVNVPDGEVADPMLRLTAFAEPVDAVLSVWLPKPGAAGAVEEVLRGVASDVAGWFVEETVPIAPNAVLTGQWSPGLANVAFLRRPEGMDQHAWLKHWRTHHTDVAIETQATLGYVQNLVVCSATAGAPSVVAIVEELFPIEEVSDLSRRMTRMLESVAAFGADKDVDVVPTRRYRLV